MPVELVHARHTDGHTLDDTEDRIVGIIVEHLDIGVGVDRPVGEAAADGRRDRAGGDLKALRRAVDDRVLPAGVAECDLRVEREADTRRVGEDESRVAAQQHADLLDAGHARAPLLRQRLRGQSLGSVPVEVGRRDDELILARKVPVNRALGQTGVLRDVADGCLFNAVFHKTRQCRLRYECDILFPHLLHRHGRASCLLCLSDGLTLLLYLFFAGISTESCSFFNEFVIQKTPVWSKNHTGVQHVKNNAGVLGASRVSHGVIAGELLVGVRAGVSVAEEEKVRGHAQRHERVGDDDDGDVSGGAVCVCPAP